MTKKIKNKKTVEEIAEMMVDSYRNSRKQNWSKYVNLLTSDELFLLTKELEKDSHWNKEGKTGGNDYFFNFSIAGYDNVSLEHYVYLCKKYRYNYDMVMAGLFTNESAMRQLYNSDCENVFKTPDEKTDFILKAFMCSLDEFKTKFAKFAN